MQIILDETECEIIYEALLTEIQQLQEDIDNRKQRGLDEKYRETYLNKARLLKMRIEPYIK